MKQKPNQIQPVKPEAKPTVNEEIRKAAEKPFFLDKYMEKHGLWITLGLVALLILVVFQQFISGNVYYLFKDIGSDSLNISFPHVALLSEYIKTEGFPRWSFAQGMGQNIMPGIGDPFSWIVILAGKEHLAGAFIWMELTKMILAALFFYKFLSHLNLSGVARIVGTLLYTFSGFMIIGSGWGIFSAEACYLALLLLSFEKLYQDNSWYLFPIPVALILMLQPFDIYLYGLFLIFYFLLRYFTSDERSWKKFFSVAAKMTVLLIIGILISSFFLVSMVQAILDSPRVGGNSSYANLMMKQPVFSTTNSLLNATTIMRFFSNDLLGNGSNFKGWRDFLEAPMAYIGLLPLILFPQVFIFPDRRKKIVFGLFLSVFAIPLIFPYFRYAFWLFTGDYFRGFSLFISLTLLLFSLLVINELDKVRKVNLPLLAITLLGLLVLLYNPYPTIDQFIKKDLRLLCVAFLLLYSGILIFMNYSANRTVAKIMLISVVIIEIGYMNYNTVNDRRVLTRQESLQKTGYNDYTVEAVAYVKSQNKNFYRINKEYGSGPAIFNSINDAKVQGYYGTPSYSSFNQKYYIRFLEETNTIPKGEEVLSRWAQGFMFRPLYQSFGSVKYNFTKKTNSLFLRAGFDSLTQIGDVKILKNRFFLPLGYTYGKYLSFDQYRKLPDGQKQIIFLKAFVAENEAIPQLKNLDAFELQDTAQIYSWDSLATDINSRKADTLRITHFSQNKITGTIQLKESKLLFLSIPYDKGWHCRLNGKPAELLLANIGFTGLNLQPGNHTIELFYKPPFFNLSLAASLLGILIYIVVMVMKRRGSWGQGDRGEGARGRWAMGRRGDKATWGQGAIPLAIGARGRGATRRWAMGRQGDLGTRGDGEMKDWGD